MNDERMFFWNKKQINYCWYAKPMLPDQVKQLKFKVSKDDKSNNIKKVSVGNHTIVIEVD